jgi:hypothetical protein
MESPITGRGCPLGRKKHEPGRQDSAGPSENRPEIAGPLAVLSEETPAEGTPVALYDVDFHRALNHGIAAEPAPADLPSADEAGSLAHAVIGWSVTFGLGAAFWAALLLWWFRG